eukprot:COSAG03_NODE_12178_length_558_cov_0.631808_1_plen_43_part_10
MPPASTRGNGHGDSTTHDEMTFKVHSLRNAHTPRPEQHQPDNV